MCGRIVILKQRITIGRASNLGNPNAVVTYRPGCNVVYEDPQGNQKVAQWADPYWARSETHKSKGYWNNWTPVRIPADGFWEKRAKFNIDSGGAISGLISPDGKGIVVLTRESSPEEKKLSGHNRQAVTA